MSWLVSDTTDALAAAERSSTLPAAIGLVVVVLALVLLVRGELLRAAAAADADPLKPVRFALAPLFLTFAAILAVRLWELV